MLTIADAGQARLVTGGVDTHAEVQVAGLAGQAAGSWAPGSSPPTRRVTRRRWPGRPHSRSRRRTSAPGPNCDDGSAPSAAASSARTALRHCRRQHAWSPTGGS